MDPIGLQGGINPFTYVYNNPPKNIDTAGLFGDGETYGPERTPGIKGHSDLECGNMEFDYTLEDHRWWSQPHGIGLMRHFRPLPAVEFDIRNDIDSCNRDYFTTHMHQGQDWFSHMGAGIGPIKHAWRGHEPDRNMKAWREANKWTCEKVKEWEKRCCK